MSDAAPLYTVFTPTYNRAGTLRRPYESLRGQTLRDFEWLVVDDGSTDNTRELVRSWQREADFPIRYAFQDNAGKAAAWNRALELARGDFFVCLDSDDECIPEALASFKEHWEGVPADERSRFSGVTALTRDQSGAPYGPDLPISPLDCSHLAVTYRMKHFHETWQCYRADVIRNFPFELIPWYRGYLPETVIINRMAASYIQRHVNQRLRVYHTEDRADVGEHLSGGLSSRDGLKHAPGIRAAHLSLLKYQFRWFTCAPARFYRVAANYVRFSFRMGIGPAAQWREVGTPLGRALWLTALPVGLALNLMDQAQGR